MTSDAKQKPVSRISQIILLLCGLTGLMFSITAICIYVFRLDRPPYQLAAVNPTIKLTREATIDQPQVQRGVILLQNVGRRDLCISNITSSCGCTVVGNWPREQISPGCTVQLRFDAELPKTGIKQSQIHISTDPPSPQSIEVLLELRGAGAGSDESQSSADESSVILNYGDSSDLSRLEEFTVGVVSKN